MMSQRFTGNSKEQGIVIDLHVLLYIFLQLCKHDVKFLDPLMELMLFEGFEVSGLLLCALPQMQYKLEYILDWHAIHLMQTQKHGTHKLDYCILTILIDFAHPFYSISPIRVGWAMCDIIGIRVTIFECPFFSLFVWVMLEIIGICTHLRVCDRPKWGM